MQLWTHHPSTFRLDLPDLKLDPKRGSYWRIKDESFRYRELAPRLWEMIGTDQFVWCCTIRDWFMNSEDADLVEWEINSPPSRVLAFVRSPVWEALVWSKSDSWDGLFLDPPTEGREDVHALVTVPLVGVICHGQLRPKLTREQEEEAREVQRNPPDAKLAEGYDC
jgi:hypothetical protein